MTPELRAAVFALPVEEKLKLVEELWDSIRDDEMPPLTEEQIAELDRRWKKFQENPESGLTWEQVEEHIRARYGR